MRNILFDLFTPQQCKGGASEYIRKVFYSLVEATAAHPDVKIYALYGQLSQGSMYSDLAPDKVTEMGVIPVEANGKTINDIVADKHIDCVFIGAAQYWTMHFDIEDIGCEVICVVHDLMDEEFANSHVNEFLQLDNTYRLVRQRLGKMWRNLLRRRVGLKRMKPVIHLHNHNPRCTIITVSEYSRNTLLYNFDIDMNRVKVLYSPARVTHTTDKIDNTQLKQLVESGKRFYLFVNANRFAKNPEKAIKAFHRYTQTKEGEDAYFVTLGYKTQKFANHVILPFLSENDLVAVMQNCYALVFASVFEGFGYPPVEAMAFGKPVLVSNVTSMPEILGSAPIYFSPIYESDMFRSLRTLNADNYDEYAEKSRKQYAEVTMRQEQDLKKLVDLLIG